MRPRAWRWNSGTDRLSSSALIWRLTADWLRLSASPAWVKLPASATAWKTRSLSQSMGVAIAALLREAGRARLGRGEKFLGFERRHAAHARRRDRLPEDFVAHIAGGKDAGNVGRGRIGLGDDVAAGIERELAFEQLGDRI